MKILIRFLILLVFSAIGLSGFSKDLKPVYLQIRLQPTQPVVRPDGVIQLDLCFKNLSGNSRLVLFPNTKTAGRKMIYFRFYTVDARDHYTNIFTEERAYAMDRSDQSPVWFHNLDEGDSVKVPVFFRDQRNYRQHIEARHDWPPLKPGNYRLLAHYDPWSEEQATMVYQKTSAFDKFNSGTSDPGRFNLDEGGLTSNYIDLTVQEDGSLLFAPVANQELCDPNCELCPAIQKGNWNLVRKLINRSSTQPFASQGNNFPYRKHRQVAYLYPGPNAILSSLPSSYSRNVIFCNAEGYHYYQIGWQVGKIYPFRSRLNYWLHYIGLGWPGKTEDLSYFQIKSFKPI